MAGKEKVKDQEMSEESKSNQLTKRTGERETDAREELKWVALVKSGPRGKAEAKTRRVDIVCDEEWPPPYAPSTLERIKWEMGSK